MEYIDSCGVVGVVGFHGLGFVPSVSCRYLIELGYGEFGGQQLWLFEQLLQIATLLH